MALIDPIPSTFDVWVTGTNYHVPAYRGWWNSGEPEELALARVHDNTHDANAVAVMYKNHQIGWVAADKAQLIGPLLDQGYQFDVRVIEHYPDKEPMKRLKVQLVRRKKVDTVPQKLPRSITFHGEIGVSNSHRAVPLRLYQVYTLRTNSDRSSVDLIDHRGDQAGWFRKAEMPEWDRIQGRYHNYLAYVGRDRALHLSTDLDGVRKLCGDHPMNVEVTYDPPSGASSVITTTNPTPHLNMKKENTMNNTFSNLISRLVSTNKKAAGDAVVLEAGRIANNTVLKLILDRMSFIDRFFSRKRLESPIGKLVIANGALLLAQQLRPDDQRVRSLTEAMAVQAYQETYQMVDIEGVIDQLLDLPELKRALKKLDAKTPAAD